MSFILSTLQKIRSNIEDMPKNSYKDSSEEDKKKAIAKIQKEKEIQLRNDSIKANITNKIKSVTEDPLKTVGTIAGNIASKIQSSIKAEQARKSSPEYLSQKEAEAQRRHELQLAQLEAQSQRRRYPSSSSGSHGSFGGFNLHNTSRNRYNSFNSDRFDSLRMIEPEDGLKELTHSNIKSIRNKESFNPVGDTSFLSGNSNSNQNPFEFNFGVKSKPKMQKKHSDPFGLNNYF